MNKRNTLTLKYIYIKLLIFYLTVQFNNIQSNQLNK